MKISNYLAKMSEELKNNDWDEVEKKYRERALAWTGEKVVDRIDDVDLMNYEKALAAGLAEAIETAEKIAAKAIYFEYDMDNDWQSNFFICPDYHPESHQDEEWVRNWVEEIEGPGLPEFTSIYDEHGGENKSQAGAGTALYLIARTVCAFGRCVDELPDLPMALCIGFHGQDPIWRIRDLEEEES